MSSTRDEVLSLIVDKIKMIHLYPGQRSVKTYLLFVMFMAARFVQFFYSWKMISNNSDSLVIMANGMRTICVNLQGTKIFSLFYEIEMAYLLKSMEKFWDSEETETIYKRCRVFAKMFQNMIYLAVVVNTLVPAVLGSLPFEADFPVFPYSFWVFTAMQTCQLMYDVTAVLATDCFFLCLSLFTAAQFKMLNERIERLGVDEQKLYSEANICIRHHVFLLKFVQTYSRIFSWSLFIQYFLTSVVFCIELFVFGKLDSSQMARSVTYLLAASMQLLLYCIPADMVIGEAGKVSDAIISSNWYNHPQFAKIYVMNMLQRAQKRVVFSACGIVNIDKVALAHVFKLIWTLYTLLRDVENLIV